jgi:hypothetical protein
MHERTHCRGDYVSRSLARAVGAFRLFTRGGNRADDIGSGKLGTRFALEFV